MQAAVPAPKNLTAAEGTGSLATIAASGLVTRIDFLFDASVNAVKGPCVDRSAADRKMSP